MDLGNLFSLVTFGSILSGIILACIYCPESAKRPAEARREVTRDERAGRELRNR